MLVSGDDTVLLDDGDTVGVVDFVLLMRMMIAKCDDNKDEEDCNETNFLV